MKLHRPPPPVRLLLIAATAVLAATGAVVATSASAESTTYQAESATLSGGVAVATDHSGYTGSGFVAGYTDGNKGNAATTFAVRATRAAGYQLAMRYANGTTATMTLSLYVRNTKIGQIALPATANWDSWSNRTDVVNLPAGNTDITYKFDGGDSGNVNLDSLTVTDIPPPPPGRYEAESAALSGGVAVATDHSGYTGSGFVAGYTDANKGNAATTFTVNVTGSGASRVTARYANGTGSNMTMSIYVNGSKVRQTTFPPLVNWDTWGTVDESLNLNAGSNTIMYKFDGSDSGNINLDNITLAAGPGPSPSPSPSPTDPGTGPVYEMETAFLSGGSSTATSTAGFTGSGYVTGLTAVGARAVRTVNRPAAGTAAVTVRYTNGSGGAKTLSVHVNGVKAGQISLPSGAGWLTASQNLPLRAGLNLISYQYDTGDSGNVDLDNVTVAGAAALAARGATVSYTEYEAENGNNNGVVVGPDRTYHTIPSESSGRRAVRLDGGKSTQITLTQPTNSVVVRASIPDNAGGTGMTAPLAVYANGAKVTDVTVSSVYSWVYGNYPFPNDPALGLPHRFFDDARATFATTYPTGTVLKLQNDGGTPITVDLIDTEVVGAPYTAPANSVDVTTFGATPGSGDDTGAFNAAINAAKGQGKAVWVPPGTFDINSRVNIDNVTIRGAGMWHTTIRGSNGKGGFFANGGTIQLADFTIAGDVRVREPNGQTNTDSAMEGNFGNNSLIYNVWVEHAKVGLWATGPTKGLYVVGVRIRDTFADGINLNDGVSGSRVDQSVFRNTGDDALAMWSHSSPVSNTAFTFNTANLPMLSNGAGIYGGDGNRIEDNLFSDTVYTATGIAISTWHEGLAFTGNTVVQRNTITRAGGYNVDWNSSQGGLWIYAESKDMTAPILIKDVEIIDSTYEAILMSWQKTITNVTFDHVTVTGAGTYGITIIAQGSATFNYVTVTGAASGGLNNTTGYTLIRGPGNSGF